MRQRRGAGCPLDRPLLRMRLLSKRPAPPAFSTLTPKKAAAPRHKTKRLSGETLARKAVEEGDFSATAVTAALEASDVPLSTNRKNVMQEGVASIRGMVVGLYAYAANVGLSATVKQFPWLTRLLTGFAQAQCSSFLFTSIQVNVDVQCRPHVDRNNLGTSLIVGLGSYQGGEVFFHDDEGDKTVTLDENLNAMQYKKGTIWRGTDHDIQNRWFEFNGNMLHCTRPFTGKRFSLVYFTSDRYQEASPEVRAEMKQAGFAFDWSSEALESGLHEKKHNRRLIRERVQNQQRAEWLQERERLGRCPARTWARGWGGVCPHYRSPESDEFCAGHASGTWRTHGRKGGPIPPAKREEMARYQRILVKKGERPPPNADVVIELPPGFADVSLPLPVADAGAVDLAAGPDILQFAPCPLD